MDATVIRLDSLKRKLKARQSKKEFRDNVVLLQTEIDRLQALVDTSDA
jgi:hypothetical protein